MALFRRLRTLADDLGLIRIVDRPATPAAKVTTRTVSLEELAARIRSEDVRALADEPAEMSLAFEQLFEAAGIAPREHGWSVGRLVELLREDRLARMSRESVQGELLERLQKEGVPVEHLVEDAVSRDAALDEYEGFVRGKVEQRSAARQRRIDELQEQADALIDEAAGLRDQAKTEKRQWEEWLDRKRKTEEELEWALSYLVEERKISR